jgi:nucleoside-diphosphate-sugar epimerase
MLGTGQQHWSTVHVADVADFFRRMLEHDAARGYYVIGNGLNPTVAELTEAAAAAGAPGAVPGSDEEAQKRLGDDFAEVLLLDQGTIARPEPSSIGLHPTQDLRRNSATEATATNRADKATPPSMIIPRVWSL